MQTDKQVEQTELDQDQEIADILGITVLSPLEEAAVSGGEVQHEDHDHVHKAQ
ncbi:MULTISPECIES: hypothetical protein [Chromobacteriaceae]|uniref:Benenodin family lasso peptide n=2 Tax=Chromobacteriaceae TaxID=1499392 RepID=A0ABV0CIC1_9NEIS|nr:MULTISPECIES: hypothetical protein [Chromobacteriaceae]ERE00123.1 hypothetical protein O166_16250 [Pseudogulbenkiania ferrooxidans EGD-HP2]NHQ81114.1 hypothetical protein [Chromobacterium vaccinii]QND82316.1 Uncharacterized protein ChrSW_0087 [Chromobacterium vaccinii]QND87546.1 Uncharacterized protein ChrSV_0087 [Chromobacterium vaccinii]SUX29458.1 Uncharacterised protein [Chromobacterium vaccinii]